MNLLGPDTKGSRPLFFAREGRCEEMASAERKKDILKAVEVELDLALPSDVAIHFEGTDGG